MKQQQQQDRVLPEKLVAALADAQSLIEERARISSLIDAAKARIYQALVEQEQASTEVASEEAMIALDGGKRSANGPYARFQALRSEVELLQQRIKGLQIKLAATDEQLLGARNALTLERNKITEVKVESFREEYRAAAETLMAVARRGVAIATAIGRPAPGLLGIEITDPFDLNLKAGRIFELKQQAGGVWLPAMPPSDPFTQEFVDVMAPVLSAEKTLSDALGEMDRARYAQLRDAERTRVAQRPQFSSGAITPSPEARAAADKQAVERAAQTKPIETVGAVMYPGEPGRNGLSYAHAYPDGDSK